jgi:multiple sugar transport system permease protein
MSTEVMVPNPAPTGRPALVARKPSRAAEVAREVGRILVLVAILAVVLYPLVWVVGSSFKSQTEIARNISVLPEEFSPENYSIGWTSLGTSFGWFYANSVLIAGLTVVGNVASCILAAYAFGRLRFRLRGFWFAIMIGTLLLPGHVLIIPQYILFRTFDWVGTLLPLLVPQFLATEAFFVFLMVQFMRGIPRELDEAARIDGCGPYQVFLRIVLPLSKPALVTTAIFSFIWTWNEFFRQLVYLGDESDWTVSVALRQFVDSTGQSNVGAMFAMSVLSLLPIFLFFLVFQRMLVEGINTSGLKG